MSGQYNFKTIQTVPPLSDFLDIVLSRTQRKTPTVVHKGYAISRIRSFYMRKVKYTRETFDEKLGHILAEFPRVDVSNILALFRLTNMIRMCIRSMLI